VRDLADELLEAKVKARLFGGEHSPRIGRLVVLDRIGSGAMGVVFAAYDPQLDRRVAVKLVRTGDAADRVLREARALGKLTHPNVVAVYDVREDDGAVVLVMELVTGVPLRAWLGERRSWRDVVRVMRDAGAGIAAAHRAGIVHRDLKPDNIVIGDDRARVVDFGIAQHRDRDADAPSAGTPSYMAPEVLAGGAATEASDQFSFGVTLYEALHGKRPHTGGTRDELARAARDAAKAPHDRDTPAWLRAIVTRALAAEPGERFASMAALVGELARDRRRRWLAFSVPALVAGAALAWLAIPGRAAVDPCTGGHARRTQSWTPALADEVRAHLGSAGWATTSPTALDATAEHWETSFRRICEATRVRGEQSDALLELRMRCLDRALDRFDALVAALRTTDRTIEASAAIGELPSPDACESLVDPNELALPSDPARRARATAAEHDLDHAWAAYALGGYRDAQAQVAAIDARTADLDVAVLRAETLLLAGSIEARIGGPGAARETLERALDAAARAGAASLELEVWAHLLREELLAGDPAHVVEWDAFAHAAAARAGRDGAELDGMVAQALRESGQFARARVRVGHALASRDPLRGDQRALLEMNLGSIELATGDPTAAEATFRRALDHARDALGDGHPTLAIYIDKLAVVDRARGRIRDALARHDQALALRLTAFGAGDRAIAASYLARAATLLEAGRLADATHDLEHARELRADALGDRSPRLAEIDALLGDVAAAAGRTGDARTLYDRAASLDRRLDLTVRRLALGPAPLDSLPRTVKPLSADRAVALAARIAHDRDAALATALLARWRALRAPAPALSLAVGDALLAVGDPGAAEAFAAGLAATSTEPTLTRLHLATGLAHATKDPTHVAAARDAAAHLSELSSQSD
jgi:tetratricopeptide (TPR) repeat protein